MSAVDGIDTRTVTGLLNAGEEPRQGEVICEKRLRPAVVHLRPGERVAPPDGSTMSNQRSFGGEGVPTFVELDHLAYLDEALLSVFVESQLEIIRYAELEHPLTWHGE